MKQAMILGMLAILSGLSTARAAVTVTEIDCAPASFQLGGGNKIYNSRREESRFVSLTIRLEQSLSPETTEARGTLEVQGWSDAAGPWKEKVAGQMQGKMVHWNGGGLDSYVGSFHQDASNYFAFGNYDVETSFPDVDARSNVGRFFWSENHGYPEGTDVPYVNVVCQRR